MRTVKSEGAAPPTWRHFVFSPPRLVQKIHTNRARLDSSVVSAARSLCPRHAELTFARRHSVVSLQEPPDLPDTRRLCTTRVTFPLIKRVKTTRVDTDRGCPASRRVCGRVRVKSVSLSDLLQLNPRSFSEEPNTPASCRS
ncbi:hypothetical protein F2P81_024868 [Scophthalmus maximus]|uniref:Uncharacterized protein n=1 Tax=Scophthalmus maximus TaxID=52904 RepID=A0A6A4RK65_SCOMX|nr:hypothetical protein F2P81_024867 [Scophthalmus maximus]KAF0022887.1 hypothetical protein F2P81_024868 [Scophthalmus maximus]